MAAAEAWQHDLQASSRFRTFGTGIAPGFEGDLTGMGLSLLQNCKVVMELFSSMDATTWSVAVAV